PSHTTVRAGFTAGPTASATITPELRSFTVLAGGDAVEEVRFGRAHAPHVEFTTSPTVGNAAPDIVELFYRTRPGPARTPLAVHGDGPARSRAPLVPVGGPVSLRLRLGTSKWGTLEMDVEPAFVGRRSPGVDAPVLQASADAASVRVDWRVDA